MDLAAHHKKQLARHLAAAPWVLRVTERRAHPGATLIVKYRKAIDDDATRTRLVERGLLYGDSMRRCVPGLQRIVARVRDEHDKPLELGPYLAGRPIAFRGNLPLDEAAGTKLSLLFKLQERVKDLDRVELMARRIDHFTPEEAGYWLSRILHFGRASSRWAAAGMRIMLGGLPGDPEIAAMLESMGE